MTYKSPVTTNLGEFGTREIEQARDLLTAMIDQPGEWDHADNVQLAFNTHSGYVFLFAEDWGEWMMNGDTLEKWHTSPHDGAEGFAANLWAETDSGSAAHTYLLENGDLLPAWGKLARADVEALDNDAWQYIMDESSPLTDEMKERLNAYRYDDDWKETDENGPEDLP